MNAKNLTFEQIKELAEIATKNSCDFELSISGEDVNIHIKQPAQAPVTTTSPYYPQISYINDPFKVADDNAFRIYLT